MSFSFVVKIKHVKVQRAISFPNTHHAMVCCFGQPKPAPPLGWIQVGDVNHLWNQEPVKESNPIKST